VIFTGHMNSEVSSCRYSSSCDLPTVL